MPEEGEPFAIYGNKLYKWMESGDGDCPVKQCTLIIDDFTHKIFDDGDVVPQFYKPSATNSEVSGDDTSRAEGQPRSNVPTPRTATPAGTVSSTGVDSSGSEEGQQGMEKEGGAEEEEGAGEGEGEEEGEGPGGGVPEEGEGAMAAVPGPYKNAWSHVGRMNQLFKVDLDIPGDGESQPTYYVEKSEDWKFQFRAEERAAKAKELLETYPGGKMPDKDETPVSWKGVVSKNCVVMNWIKRNYDQPPVSDVTNAIYTHLMSEHELKYIFAHDVENVATEKYITTVIFSEERGLKWPPEKDCRLQIDTSDEYKKYYMDLLGTPIGRTVAHLVLGRYPRGSCTISNIQISVSGINYDGPLRIDMLFVLKTTKPAHRLKQAKLAIPIAGAKVAGKGKKPAAPAPPPGGKPLELAIAAAGAVPPPGGKPIDTAIAVAAHEPDHKKAFRKNMQAIIKRKADELQEKENDDRYGKLRSGLKWR